MSMPRIPTNTMSHNRRKSPLHNSETTTIFEDASLKKHWSDIEHALSHNGNSKDENGWIEGQIHEIHITQKEVEILLVPSNDTCRRSLGLDILRVFISCPNYFLFTFAINQVVKISLRGARVVKDLSRKDSNNTMGSLSLIFATGAAIQSVRKGIFMQDGAIIDSWEAKDNLEGAYILPEVDFELLSLSESEVGTPRVVSSLVNSPNTNQVALPPPTNSSLDVRSSDEIFDIDSCPHLNTLYNHVNKFVPIFGVVVSIKPMNTSATGSTFINMTIADGQTSNENNNTNNGGRFQLTCFRNANSPTDSRDLPLLQVGDAVLFRSVKIKHWESTDKLIGTVYNYLMDYVVFRPGRESRDETYPGSFGTVESGNEVGMGKMVLPPHVNDISTLGPTVATFYRAAYTQQEKFVRLLEAVHHHPQQQTQMIMRNTKNTILGPAPTPMSPSSNFAINPNNSNPNPSPNITLGSGSLYPSLTPLTPGSQAVGSPLRPSSPGVPKPQGGGPYSLKAVYTKLYTS